MTDSEDAEMPEDIAEGAPPGVGEQLRAARERKGLTLEQVVSETRISRRHLENIEAGDFEALPSRTYVVGFTRTYARAVGLDEDQAIAQVREELDEAPSTSGYGALGRTRDPDTFEPGDPSRAPGGKLLYFSLFAAAVLLVGIFFAARALFSPAAEMPSLVEQQEQEEAEALAAAQAEREPATAEAADPAGPVVFTAEGETWVRFYDGEGNVLREGTLSEGESFTLPADAQDPQIITGRPDLLAITIGGRSVRKLSEESETLQDVPVSAEALLARGGVQTVGFGLGTAAAEPAAAGEPAPAPQSAGPTVAATPAPAVTPSPTPTPMATSTSAAIPPPATPPAPAATPSSTATAVEDVEAPDSAATAPPQAIPAEPTEDGVSPEIE